MHWNGKMSLVNKQLEKKIIYFTGTRADFGLMQSTLLNLHSSEDISLGIAVTGMHLSTKYGDTVKEIEASGLEIVARIPVELEPETAKTMALAMSTMIMEFSNILEFEKPDLIMVLGDRGEMLAASLASLHLGIPTIHIHGGERSGTIDESIRHAISKLSHIHFVSTDESKKRLCSLGELPQHIYITGAPGLDGIEKLAIYNRQELVKRFGLTDSSKICLLVFHPVVQESALARQQIKTILQALLQILNLQIIAIMPNSDAGSESIRQEMSLNNCPQLQVFSNLSRSTFVSFMKVAEVMVGNSSAGIIEAASFDTPVVNIGSRQNLRQRNSNVSDVDFDCDAIFTSIQSALSNGKLPCHNIYGDGSAGINMLNIIKTLDLDKSILNKVLTY